jgi:hypothetical protein
MATPITELSREHQRVFVTLAAVNPAVPLTPERRAKVFTLIKRKEPVWYPQLVMWRADEVAALQTWYDGWTRAQLQRIQVGVEWMDLEEDA